MVTSYTAPTAASGTNWTSPTNVYASDNSRASYATSTQDDLKITGFGFAIPTGSTILGFEVLVEGNGASATANNRSIRVGATKDGSALAGSRLANQNLPQTTDGNLTFGSATNLFSTTWTVAEVNASTFGILLSVGSTNTSQRNIDQVQVRIYYSPPISNLSDNYDDNSLDATKWVTNNASSGTATESSQRINLTPANSTAGSQGGISSVSNYNLTSGIVQVKAVQVADLTNCFTNFLLYLDTNNYLGIGTGSSNLEFIQKVAGIFSTPYTTAYNSTTHKYWRIRETNGRVYVDYSADAKTWICFYNLANPFAVTSLQVQMYVYENVSTATPGSAQFDDFNITTNADAIDTLTDNFDDNSRDTTKWNTYTANSGAINETNNQLEYQLAATTNGSWSGYHSVNQYNLTGKRASVKVPALTTGGHDWFDLNLSMEQLAVVDNFIAIGFDFGLNQLQAILERGGSDTVLASATYDSTNHRYISIRESGGTIYWEYSADGVNWSTLYSHAIYAEIPVTNLYVVLDDYEYDATSTPSLRKFDDFNILSTTTTKTVTGISRVTVTTTKTSTGKSSIQKTTSQTITGKTRVTETTPQTITGVSRVTKTTPQTITGVSRVTKTTPQTITGTSRVTVSTQKYLSGTSRITKTTPQTITGVSRVTATTSKTITGKSSVQETTPQTLTGKSRVTIVTPKTVTGVSRITKTTPQTITGQSRITATTPKTITGKSSIQKTTPQTITGKASIASSSSQTITGKTRVTVSTPKTVSGVSRVTKTTSQAVTGKGRIETVSSQTIVGKGRVEKSVPQTITGKSRVTASSSQGIVGKSRVTVLSQQGVNGISRVEIISAQAITGKAYIVATGATSTQTITGKSRITESSKKTLSGKALIMSTISKPSKKIVLVDDQLGLKLVDGFYTKI